MTIKELETILNISRANIRFYEKEGFIKPKRNKNGYRNYSKEDLEILQKIIILRKIDISIDDIKLIVLKKEDLQNIISHNLTKLNNEQTKIKGAIELCKKIQKEAIGIEDLNFKYFDEISYKENKGVIFSDLSKDYLVFEKNIWDKMWASVFFINNTSVKNYSLIKFILFYFSLMCLRGVGSVIFYNTAFIKGFSYPLSVFLYVSIVYLPIYILSKKSPKLAQKITNLITYTLILCFILLAIFLIALILNSIFHFWW